MKRKKIIFSIFAALLPLAFLVLVEVSLWVVDAYPQPPLFLEFEDEEKAFIQVNSQVGERYFNKNVMPVPNLYPQTFEAQKGSKTTRIFCIGGSTTAGFPYEMTVPFPRQLEMLLRADYPNQEFEVINLGLSAINSFTVLDWIPEILDQDPDLILMYMGHNEFYGAYGTGSTISLGHDGRIVRLVLKLQKLRTVQMVYSIIRGASEPASIEASSTLMEKVIDDKFIESNSVLRIQTRVNFAANLDAILKKCQSADVPIILSNLVSNIRDQVPLDMTSSPQKKATKAYNLYQKGLLEFDQGDTVTAYISLTRARNNDQVPFRGNDYINEILSDRARRHGLTIVDMENAFRRASPSGIPGSELFCDHLHPNPLGYHIMAREFQVAIATSSLLPAVEETQLPIKPLLVTNLDWEIGGLKVFKLLHRWPFGNRQVDYSHYEPISNESTVKIAQDYLFKHHIWGKAHSEMADYLLERSEFKEACQEYQAIIEIYPAKVAYYTKLVDCAKQANLYELVVQTCEKAMTITSERGMFHYNLAISKRVSGEMEAAMTHIKAAIEAPELTRVQSANVYFTYALFLLDLHKPSEAAAVLTELVSEVPDFTKAQELLQKLIN